MNSEDKKYHESVVAIERSKARYEGRLEGLRESLCDDEVVQKKLRADAWRSAGADLGDGIPAGWPEGVDGEAVVRGWVMEKTAHLDLTDDGDPPALERDAPSQSVSAFRKAIGGKS